MGFDPKHVQKKAEEFLADQKILQTLLLEVKPFEAILPALLKDKDIETARHKKHDTEQALHEYEETLIKKYNIHSNPNKPIDFEKVSLTGQDKNTLHSMQQNSNSAFKNFHDTIEKKMISAGYTNIDDFNVTCVSEYIKAKHHEGYATQTRGSKMQYAVNVDNHQHTGFTPPATLPKGTQPKERGLKASAPSLPSL